MNILSANLVYLAPIPILILYAFGLVKNKYVKPSFKHQALVTAVFWTLLLPLHLQLSGWGLTPGIPNLIGVESWPLFNWYNIPIPMSLFGLQYDQGFLVTNFTHAAAAILFALTVDLFFDYDNPWKQTAVIWIVVTFLLNVWKFNEFANGFNGSYLDTQMDWLAQDIGLLLLTPFLFWRWKLNEPN